MGQILVTTEGKMMETNSITWVLLLTVSLKGALCEIDLTHTIREGFTAPYPANNAFKFTKKSQGVQDAMGGVYMEYNEFMSPEHCGTHTDAPAHFAEGKWSIDEIPFDRLSGPGVVIDISNKARTNPEAMLTVADIREWERRNGKIPIGAVVIMNSGYSKHYLNGTMYFGREEGFDPMFKEMHYPGFSGEAIQFLVEERDIVGVASDTMSVDAGSPKRPWEAHKILAANDVWGLENLANVDLLPPKGFILYNNPMKIGTGSGAPSRVFARMLNHDMKPMLVSSGIGVQPSLTTISTFFFVILKCF